MKAEHSCLIIGGGPAGSTAAALLAREGFDVTLVEREFFPRYHIGESLLPSLLAFLDLTGAREKVEAHGFQRKPGGHFTWGSQQWDLLFNDLSGAHTYSFQVIRSEFDQLLLDHAQSQGAKVLQGVEVQKLHFDQTEPQRPVGATLADLGGSGKTWDVSFDFLVDASGRSGVMASRYLRNRRYHEAFKNVAVWSYWKNTRRLPHPKEGAIATVSIPEGWIWAIPLHDDTMSVGVVMHKDCFKAKRADQGLEEIYKDSIAQSPVVSELLEPGERLHPQLRVETDYSYAAEQFAGPGYFLIGDAACFLDPLLSTGVHLAMLSATLAAASLISLFRGEVSGQEARIFFEDSYRCAYLRLLVFVSTFYKLYDGKDSIFWMAQQLSYHDTDGNNLKSAFTNLVSGLSDLQDVNDAGEATRRLVLEEMSKRLEENVALRKDKQALLAVIEQDAQRVHENDVFFNKIRGVDAPALSAENAIQGLYVVTKPRLGLARVTPQNGHPAT